MNTEVTAYVGSGGSFLSPTTYEQAWQLAEAMAAGKLMPAHLQGSPADCLMIIERARNWRMSPFAVAEASGLVRNRLMFEGKLVAAAVQTSGAIVGNLDYTFDGAGDNRKVTVIGTRRGDDSPRTIDLVLKDVRTDNRMWVVQPDQQLTYAGARVWARRWTPAVMLGVYVREEFFSNGAPYDPSIIEGTAEPVREEPHTPPPPPPIYYITLPNGAEWQCGTGTEFLDQWRVGLQHLSKNKKAIVALAKANARHLLNVSSFDPAAAAQVEDMMKAATKELNE